ncbi:hypothetical protein C7999DRAFT_13184 [Corynascus novoguineensis]|uniref:Pathway-specific nitrogen regulator n=1 Tax=Corynascus novoguineensis TaxID=1126955 RepID=A0AAN7HKH4_9PEZI|nr:hypothetical protein C7999DRAFT_13184 [Corynascus novoguineensis]
MPRKAPELDLDFNIHVDPSCLSNPMDGETPETMPPSADELHEIVIPDTPAEEKAAADAAEDTSGQAIQDATSDAAEQGEEPPATEGELPSSDGPSSEEPEPLETEPLEQEPAPEQPEPAVDESAAQEPPTTENEEPAHPSAADETTPSVEDAPVTEPTAEADAVPEVDATPTLESEASTAEPEQVEEPAVDNTTTDVQTEPTPDLEPASEPLPEVGVAEEILAENNASEAEIITAADPPSVEEPDSQSEEQEAAPESAPAPDESINGTHEVAVEEHVPVQEAQADESPSTETQEVPGENVGDDPPHDQEAEGEEEDSRQPNFTDRKTSLRTEALIQAAARAVVAKIEKRKSGDLPGQDDELDDSLISADSQDTYVLENDAQNASDRMSPAISRRQSAGSQVRHIPSRSTSSDEAGDSSSHNEREDDVFSVRSARSSLCSLDHDDFQTKTPQAKESLSRRDSYSSTLHHPSSSSPARTVSNFSTISGLSQYDNEYYDSDLSPKHTFVPFESATMKPTRRMPFRTPSEIRAMQMASPTPSVFNGSSPARRSSPRGEGSSGRKRSSLPGTGATVQYSPKGRSTPPRFKSAAYPPKEAPLVLLHVTLLPLRWAWAGVLEGMDSIIGAQTTSSKGAVAFEEEGEGCPPAAASRAVFEPSDQLKGLRDAWRELQDRVGDTVLERGILLPHPQNDYEVLEERLLEALELPLRRRARILECGHYVGPANVVDPDEIGSSDGEGEEEANGDSKRHWCATCRSEIRYEDLGPGKVFRVKVYASNGLMRAGAWEACWKEMERVDVEVEPIVDAVVQNELEKLGVLQMELDEQQQRRRELELERSPEPEVAAELKREAAFIEQEPRAPSRQQTETPLESELAHHMDAQRAMMSSPAPSGMQLAVRAATPTTTPYPVDTSDERRLRDEERMREIYGDSPPAPAPAPAPAQHPAPPAPMENTQQHQQQQQQQQLQQHYQQFQPPHSHAMTVATPPLLTEAPYHRPQSPDEYSYDHRLQSQGQSQSQGQGSQYRSRAPTIVLDENASFVELLMEAFKVLLRDPKNVAIIVLCVFLVVLMKRPGAGEVPQALQQQHHHQQQPAVVQVVPPGSGGLTPAAGAGYDAPVVVGGGVNGPKADEITGNGGGVVASSSERAPVMDYVAEVLASTGVPEVEGLEPVVAADEPLAVIETELVSGREEPEVEDEVPAAGVEQVVSELHVEAARAEEEGQQFGGIPLPADVCAPRGLEYPITPVDGVPAFDEAGTKDQPPAGPEPEVPEVSTPLNGVNEVSDDPVEFDTESEQDEFAGKCEIEFDADADDAVPTPSAPSASTSVFLPGPFVTERKTVRVFETLTETVRVSVVTQTETVSTVVTAIPQTVEETVYETETVRITVSVPVEDEKKKKVQATKGCKGKRGWF